MIYGLDWSYTDQNELVTCSEDRQIKVGKWDPKFRGLLGVTKRWFFFFVSLPDCF